MALQMSETGFRAKSVSVVARLSPRGSLAPRGLQGADLAHGSPDEVLLNREGPVAVLVRVQPGAAVDVPPHRPVGARVPTLHLLVPAAELLPEVVPVSAQT